MTVPEVNLSRTRTGKPAVTVWGVTLGDGLLIGAPFFVAHRINARTRLVHNGVKYEMPRLERGFYMLQLEVKAVT